LLRWAYWLPQRLFMLHGTHRTAAVMRARCDKKDITLTYKFKGHLEGLE
jgi:hypothetical protein